MRKLLLLLIAFLGFSFMTQINTGATEVNMDEVNKIVDIANEKIYNEINQAQLEASLLNPDCNYDEELDSIINELLLETYQISQETINEVALEYGVQVDCEYVEVLIGNRLVLVDPLRVHFW